MFCSFQYIDLLLLLLSLFLSILFHGFVKKKKWEDDKAYVVKYEHLMYLVKSKQEFFICNMFKFCIILKIFKSPK